ncbi:hypothetical protein OESDEN_01203 [Oesophagostomum dentatum]|uniref:Reverse transcriptase domain-containing protein n=1 Tax=Oesophagostomum dentatum TaxID=61180 RepID=A0A0B1TRS7_OESDE|nr:hypothetical protein OESDEN_01203 [Oesophagostomum dentatum]
MINYIHVQKQIAEKSAEHNSPVYIALVNFRKAFDVTEWNAVWRALARRGVDRVHPELIDMLRRIYESSTTSLLINSCAVLLNIRRSVKQGDTLSPELFDATLQIVLDSAEWEGCGLKIGGRMLSHLEYAYDVMLLAPTHLVHQKMLHLLRMLLLKRDLKSISRKLY